MLFFLAGLCLLFASFRFLVVLVRVVVVVMERIMVVIIEDVEIVVEDNIAQVCMVA